jgi:FK506-binding protein 1
MNSGFSTSRQHAIKRGTFYIEAYFLEQNYRTFFCIFVSIVVVLLVYWISPTSHHRHPTTSIPTIVIKDNLTKQIKRAGDGKSFPVAQKSVSVLYKLHINRKFVEEEQDRLEPFVTKIGVGAVIVGWDLGIVTMSIGEICTLIVPPEMGYGPDGSGEEVPGNSTLIFEIELLKID